MRYSAALVSGLICVAPSAMALKIDAKALARFDVTYAPCETRFAEMRGRGDEVYLSLWNAKLDAHTRAQLGAARKAAPYLTERRRLVPTAPPAAGTAAASAFEQECRDLWTQAQRSMQGKV